MNFEELFGKGPDVLYHFAEEHAKIANECYKKDNFADAFRTMYEAVSLLKQYRTHFDGPQPILDFEMGMYLAEFHFYKSHFFLKQDRYVLGEREARFGLNELKKLPFLPNKHAQQKLKRFITCFLELMDHAQLSRDEATNSRLIDMINARDVAGLMGRDRRANEISSLIDMLETEK
ncbi:hypothetical protein KY312_02205 [Candidatus Woesearchaeota archaeon]|nr:hypothetical protein [Candidatus Woesearchaeota archaeon]